jgi:hypothetical protein
MRRAAGSEEKKKLLPLSFTRDGGFFPLSFGKTAPLRKVSRNAFRRRGNRRADPLCSI